MTAIPCASHAADIPATPADYREKLATLQPGDTMTLAAGDYPRLTLDGLHGRDDAWITIEGPSSGAPAVVTAESCCNTVQIRSASYLAIRNLVVDVGGLEVDAINGKDASSHHVLIERNTLRGFPTNNQQIVGINTKVTVWNWTIRGNTIFAPGTGLYLGDSDGSAPFVAGTIEYNVIENPLGYAMQIKHQQDYSAVDGMPPEPHRTFIRHNAFLKDDRQSPSGDRPNLLIGGFPDTGYGSGDVVEIYGNVFAGNPRESQFQATGRFSLHDNLFIGVGNGQNALTVTAHQGKDVRLAQVYNNTFYGGARGIYFASPASEDSRVVGNLVFAGEPIAGPIMVEEHNLSAPLAMAANFVTTASAELSSVDLYPRAGAVDGDAFSLDPFTADAGHAVDFNGSDKGARDYRGAYVPAASNPGCSVAEFITEPQDCAARGSGTGGGESSDGGGSDGDGTGSGGSVSGSDSSGSTGPAAEDGTAASGPSGDDAEATDSGSGESANDSAGCGCRGSGSLAWGLPLLIAIRRRRKS